MENVHENEDLGKRYETDRENEAYLMIAMDVPLLHAIHQKPIKQMNVMKYRYHQSCRLSCRNRKLKGACKRKHTFAACLYCLVGNRF